MNVSSPSHLRLLSENDPLSEGWSDASFVGRLTEGAVFDRAAYMELEAAVIGAASTGASGTTLGAIIRIIERITLLLKCHVDTRDVYRIGNLDDDEVAELDRRARFCLREISVGNTPDVTRW